MAAGKKPLVSNTAVELPEDIALEILLRLRVEPLVRFKCVCKSWRFLINDPKFVRKHLNHANITKLIVFADKSSVPTFQSINYEEESNGFLKASKLDFSIDPKLDYRVAGCCDGLLCLVTTEKSIVIWNPSIRKYTKLPVPIDFSYCDIYGLGYDSSIDDYKVIRAPYSPATPSFDVEVLTLKTNLWRRILRFSVPLYVVKNNCQAILTNGALHWPALKQSRCLILCFDLAEEKFREVLLPCSIEIEKLQCGVAIFGGCLSLLDLPRFGDVAIWVMKEYGVTESWIKAVTISMIQTPTFSITRFALKSKLLCFTKSGGVLLTLIGSSCFVYNPKDNSSKPLKVCGIKDWSDDTLYAESLVSPYGAN